MYIDYIIGPLCSPHGYSMQSSKTLYMITTNDFTYNITVSNIGYTAPQHIINISSPKPSCSTLHLDLNSKKYHEIILYIVRKLKWMINVWNTFFFILN